jgi:hypothetical protein
MWRRAIKIKSTIVREFEAWKVPSSHPFWLEMASTYLNPVVVRHLRNIVESPQSDHVSVSHALTCTVSFLLWVFGVWRGLGAEGVGSRTGYH